MKRYLYVILIAILVSVSGCTMLQDNLIVNETKAFQPFSIPGYTIQIPANTVLPNRDDFVLSEVKANINEPRIIIHLYRNKNYIYVTEKGKEELIPYFELIFVDIENKHHLLIMCFINNYLQFELYENSFIKGYSNDWKSMVKIDVSKHQDFRILKLPR